jgi:thiamine transport system substrate-binding protein
MTHPIRRLAALVLAAALAATACGDDSATSDPTATATDVAGTTVTIVTHDSFNVTEEVLVAFEERTGITVEILPGGDAGSVVNQAILTAGNPQGDILFGIDNTFLSRALDADLFVPYESPALADVDPDLILDDEHRVTPIDTGDVCLNYDREAFAASGLPVPQFLEDLTDPQYASMLVVENPATSSPGLAFLLATVATFGEDGYLDFWAALRANDVAVSSGWEDAYYGQFSGGSGEGDRPLVVSYASSPPAEVFFAEEELDEAPTGAIVDSCFRQIEFAGILAGTDNEAGARAVIDFLLSPEFQADIPLQMFVFPARNDVDLPEVFTAHAEVPAAPITMDPAEIAANRDAWIDAWTQTVLR